MRASIFAMRNLVIALLGGCNTTPADEFQPCVKHAIAHDGFTSKDEVKNSDVAKIANANDMANATALDDKATACLKGEEVTTRREKRLTCVA